MSLSARNRSAILNGLSTVIPESEAVKEIGANASMVALLFTLLRLTAQWGRPGPVGLGSEPAH